MMATIQYNYNNGSACTSDSWGGTGFINYDSAATNVIRVDDWVETNIYVDTCYGNSGTTSNAISYNYRVKKRTQMWSESGNWFIGEHKHVARPLKTPSDRLREIIQTRQAPMVIVSRKPILTPQDDREIRARETLLRVIGADKFQKFLKDGFVSVRAKSGMVYQIFPGHGVTAVYRDGEQIERLCVVLKGDFPPTDSLIMRYLIILNDEARFRSYAIKHHIITKKPQIVADQRSLADIFRELKNVA